VQVLELEMNSPPAASADARSHTMTPAIGATRRASPVPTAVTIAPENRELQHRPEEVARELVVVDDQDVNSLQFFRQSVHRGRQSMTYRQQ
jgi:hypothetical protein